MTRRPGFRIDELAKRLSGELHGDGSLEVRGLASLTDAGPDDLSFYATPQYHRELDRTRAGALITRERLGHVDLPQILLADPFLAINELVDLFYPEEQVAGGRHPLAFVADSAQLGDKVTVLPYATVGEDVRIGANTVLHPGVYLGRGVTIGADCLLWPNVVVREGCEIGSRVILHAGAVVGSDGFGYARRGERFVKLRHVGTVVIEDDVEVGANATIDRANLGRTIIRRGVKIDNLVHIAHNVDVGEHSVMAAQTGISGSTRIGKRVMMGGQVGMVDHLTIGDDAVFIAQSGVIGNVAEGAKVSGYPARDHGEVLKAQAELRGLGGLRRRVRALEQELQRLGASRDQVEDEDDGDGDGDGDSNGKGGGGDP